MTARHRAMTTLRRAVTGFLLLKLSILLLNMVQFPVLHRTPGPRRPAALTPTPTPAPAPPRTPAPAPTSAPAPSPRGSVSLLVPVRNEAANLAASVTALLRQNADELILLDDESSDGSGALARTLLAAHPQARVLTGTAAPAGWVGKNWACHQLAAAASGSLLLFCDADVLLADGSLEAVITEMRAQHADVFSVFPRQLTATLGEHLITPLIDDVLLCFLPFALLSADVPAAATANGALLVFTRQAYDQLGGFAAVRAELVEDVALARRTRAAGLKLGLVLGGDLVATRMYAGYRQVLAGMAKGLLPVTGGSRSRLILGTGWHLLAYTLPWAMAWPWAMSLPGGMAPPAETALPSGLAARRRAWALPVFLGVTERVLVEIKTGRRAVWQAVLTPLSPLAAIPLLVRALRGTQRWKGRVYS